MSYVAPKLFEPIPTGKRRYLNESVFGRGEQKGCFRHPKYGGRGKPEAVIVRLLW